VIAADLFAGAAGVLCLGAHPDDIEIGCGGTLFRLRRTHPDLDIRWLVLTGDQVRRVEAAASAAHLLGDAARLSIRNFRDGFVPLEDVAGVKNALIAHRNEFVPDIVFAPRREDAHQDHRLLGELVWQVFRDQVVLHYELAKFDGDLGSPNVYVALDVEDVDAKVAHLLDVYPSQASKPWFDAEVFRGMMRVRGVECASPSGHAEAFEAPKLVIA
jgi:LmbE family N-acetylglucosaminyl deacetylase